MAQKSLLTSIMETIQLVTERLKKAFPDSEININDYKHDGMHVILQITSEKFNGLTLIQQHKLVYAELNDLIQSNQVHALKLKTIPTK
jgi:stress-induced morphogen